MRNRRRRYTLVSNLGIDDVAFAGLLHRRCSLGSVGSEVGKHKVQLGNGQANPLVTLVNPLSS